MSNNDSLFDKPITATGRVNFGQGYFKGVFENGIMKKGIIKLDDYFWFEGERVTLNIENPDSVYGTDDYEPDIISQCFLKGTIYICENEYYEGHFYEDSFFRHIIRSWGEACYIRNYHYEGRKEEWKEVDTSLVKSSSSKNEYSSGDSNKYSNDNPNNEYEKFGYKDVYDAHMDKYSNMQ
ncbi:hypothetical protein [Terrisporobacter hibernicus]|uniref:Uncharacterized protein n=1 Tax=Terrisporobacter hibernicus TaxID=2813371 RepID=A0AAX2ZFU3_9FIRM|nr:hypothetical protein [Terrisporobacter hibernicus]UEL48203.1 hypothetical protein JW646_01770 [Terrisporobacter hibernicus]